MVKYTDEELIQMLLQNVVFQDGDSIRFVNGGAEVYVPSVFSHRVEKGGEA